MENENEYDYLSVLTYEDKQKMIKDLENDNVKLKDIIDNPNLSEEQREEFTSELNENMEQLNYLKSHLNDNSY